MSRQTIATVPIDTSDDVAMKRFLGELTDNLDRVLGYKGDSTYVNNKDLSTTTADIAKKIEESLSSIKEQLEELKTSFEDVGTVIEELDTVLSASVLGTAFYDFNSSSWSSLVGRGELTADGGDLSNTPFEAEAGTDYTVYVDSTKTQGAVWQEIFVNGSSKYARDDVSSSWLQLA